MKDKSIQEEIWAQMETILLQVFNDGFVMGEIGVGDDHKTTGAALDQILKYLDRKDVGIIMNRTGADYQVFIRLVEE